MKKIYTSFYFVILLVTCLPTSPLWAAENQLVTELSVFDNDSTFRYLYLYDGDGNKVLETKYFKRNTDWIRKSQTEWLYDAHKCTTQRERRWTNNDWAITYTIDYEYLNDRVVSELHNVYSNGVASEYRKINFEYLLTLSSSKSEYFSRNGAWVLSQVDDYAYFGNAKTQTITTSVYQAGSIARQFQSAFTYNAAGLVLTQLLKEKVGIADWVNSELINWYYKTGSSLIISQRNKTWDTGTSKWQNNQKIDYLYNAANQLVSETNQHWKLMFWENDFKYDYEYDSSAKQVKKTLALSIYHQWRGTISINYSNFSFDKANLMESEFDFWGGSAGELTSSYIPFMFNNEIAIQKAQKIEISYLPITDMNVPTAEYFYPLNLIPVYPNPSEGIYYINTQNYKVQSWSVSDLNGRIIQNQIQSNMSGVIDLTSLPKGIYLLRVNTPSGQLIQKLIKQ